MYTANNFANGAVILRTDPADRLAVEISRNGPQGNHFMRPYDLAVEADGSLLVADMGVPNQKDGALIRVDPFTGAQSVVSSGAGFYDPAGIAVAPDGTLYVVDNLSADNNGGVIRVDPRTGAQKLIASNFNVLGLFDLPFGIAVDRDGSLVVVNRRTAGALPTDCLLRLRQRDPRRPGHRQPSADHPTRWAACRCRSVSRSIPMGGPWWRTSAAVPAARRPGAGEPGHGRADAGRQQQRPGLPAHA